ncbi:MAG: hypothetical protein ACHQE6_07545 [Solirubrobacterales bacterium]
MNLDLALLRRPQWLMGGGALALFVFTFFFKWFGASIATEVGGVSLGFHLGLDAWHSLADTRWLLLLTILAALFRVGAEAGGRELELPVPASAIVALLAGLCAICVLYRIIDHPHLSVSYGPTTLHYGAELGIYLGFIACVAIAYGALEDLRAGAWSFRGAA